jgi:hypothetical protein
MGQGRYLVRRALIGLSRLLRRNFVLHYTNYLQASFQDSLACMQEVLILVAFWVGVEE